LQFVKAAVLLAPVLSRKSSIKSKRKKELSELLFSLRGLSY
jgi:hypothetical protein